MPSYTFLLMKPTPFFTTVLIDSLFVELSSGLFVNPGRPLSEAEVRHDLISPLLRRIAHSIPSLPEPEHEGLEVDKQLYSSSLNVKVATGSRCHVPGAKPRVDYVLTGTVGDTLYNNIPTEVKKRIVTMDLAQMAQYHATFRLIGI